MPKRIPKFQVGQSVKLNTESPVMKVLKQDQSPYFKEVGIGINVEFNGYYTCQWFNKTDYNEAQFAEESLISV
jgi:uncharacterized protein YodC (DUF2158 family)